MSTPIKPLADYVVAKQEDAVTRTKSGLYIADSAAERPLIAVILAVGKKVSELKAGDKIVYKSAYGSVDKVKIDNVEYILIKEEDVLATVN